MVTICWYPLLHSENSLPCIMYYRSKGRRLRKLRLDLEKPFLNPIKSICHTSIFSFTKTSQRHSSALVCYWSVQERNQSGHIYRELKATLDIVRMEPPVVGLRGGKNPPTTAHLLVAFFEPQVLCIWNKWINWFESSQISNFGNRWLLDRKLFIVPFPELRVGPETSKAKSSPSLICSPH